MSYSHHNQPQSKLESHSSDWESLQLWSTNDSSSKLTCLIERETLTTNVRSREIKSSKKSLPWLTLGLMLSVILYASGLITLTRIFTVLITPNQIYSRFTLVRLISAKSYVYTLRKTQVFS